MGIAGYEKCTEGRKITGRNRGGSGGPLGQRRIKGLVERLPT